MPEDTAHLTRTTVEELADGLMTGPDRQQAEAHLRRCTACSAEFDAAQSLFLSLAALPRFAPSAEFADLVMARIQVTPRASPIFAWIRHWAPETRRGWSALIAALLAPMLPILGFAVWVISNPTISASAVLHWSVLQGRSSLAQGMASAASYGAESGLTSWLDSIYLMFRNVPMDALVAAGVLLAVAIPLSAWSLVRLARTPSGNVTYAN